MFSANKTAHRIVIDANVVLHWVIHSQSYHLQSQLLLSDCAESDILLFAPPTYQAEVDSAIRRSVHLRLLSEDEGEKAFELLDELPVIISSHPTIHHRAREIARLLDQPRVYDATYAALTEFLGCSLWTADRRFFNVAHSKFPFIYFIESYKSGLVNSLPGY